MYFVFICNRLGSVVKISIFKNLFFEIYDVLKQKDLSETIKPFFEQHLQNLVLCLVHVPNILSLIVRHVLAFDRPLWFV